MKGLIPQEIFNCLCTLSELVATSIVRFGLTLLINLPVSPEKEAAKTNLALTSSEESWPYQR